MEISKLVNLELNPTKGSFCISDKDVESLATKIRDLGFGYKYLPPSKSKIGADIVFIDVFYKTPVLFTDENGTKFLIPNYKKSQPDKLSRKCCTICIHYSSAKFKNENQWKQLVSVDCGLKGSVWEYNRKRDILRTLPVGMSHIYEFGSLSDFIDEIVNSFAKLKEYIDNGKEYPIKK